jgi:hypothetical protein
MPWPKLPKTKGRFGLFEIYRGLVWRTFLTTATTAREETRA